jgi:hypothetical protein
MTDSATFLTPAPMEGHGVYNRSSRVQAAGLSPAVPLLEQAAKSVPLPAGPDPILLVDYGSSEGHNSLGPLTTAIGVLRERLGPERAISVVHTDLPDNDFTALFRTLAADPNSYLRGNSEVFALAVGRSFYEQILPAGSVTLAWSSWAIQWLSRLPAVIPDQVQVAYSRDPAARGIRRAGGRRLAHISHPSRARTAPWGTACRADDVRRPGRQLWVSAVT